MNFVTITAGGLQRVQFLFGLRGVGDRPQNMVCLYFYKVLYKVEIGRFWRQECFVEYHTGDTDMKSFW